MEYRSGFQSFAGMLIWSVTCALLITSLKQTWSWVLPEDAHGLPGHFSYIVLLCLPLLCLPSKFFFCIGKNFWAAFSSYTQCLSHIWFSITIHRITNWKDGYCFGFPDLFYNIRFFFLFSTSTFLLCAQWLRWYVFRLVIMLSELLTLLTISSYLWAVVRNEWGDSDKASSTVLGM